MSSSQLEAQFQERIAQAKEAARLASIAAAARAENASKVPSFAPVSGTPFHAPPLPPTSTNFAPALKSLPVPLDAKNRIDRLVEFVARNGDVFEATVKQREANNPDFAFLKPDGPYSDYYQAKKRQCCGTQPVTMELARSPPARAPTASSFNYPLESTDLLGMSVGAMANVCKFARMSGVEAYAPIPREVILGVARLPPVEPARLEIRLLEFYRDDYDSS